MNDSLDLHNIGNVSGGAIRILRSNSEALGPANMGMLLPPWRGPARELCNRTIPSDRELTREFARRIVFASGARGVENRGVLCALLGI